MKRISCWLGALVVAVVLIPLPAAAQCRPESGETLSSLVNVYAKRHADETYTVWYVHTLLHEVLCGTEDCDSNPDEYVWRSGSTSNANVASLTPTDSCGESMILVPTNPSLSSVARMRMKFGEFYHSTFPKVHDPHRKDFNLVVKPGLVNQCECVYQLLCDDTAGTCGDTVNLFPGQSCTSC